MRHNSYLGYDMTPNDISKLLPHGVMIPQRADELIRAWQANPNSLSECDFNYLSKQQEAWYLSHQRLDASHQLHAFENFRALSELELQDYVQALTAFDEYCFMTEHNGFSNVINHPAMRTFSGEHIEMMRNRLTRRLSTRVKADGRYTSEFLEWLPNNNSAGWIEGHFPSGLWTGPPNYTRASLVYTSVIIFYNIIDGYSFRNAWE